MPKETKVLLRPRRRDAMDRELEKYRPTLEEELRDCLEQLHRNEVLFDMEVEEDLIEQRIYERKAILSRYRYLQSRARAMGLRAIL